MQLLAIWWHMEITSKLFLNGNSFLLQQYCIIIFVTFCTACNFTIFLHCFHVKSGAYFIPCYFWWWRAMQWTLQHQPSVEQNSVPGLLWHITRCFWRLWNIMKYTHTQTNTYIYIYIYTLTNTVWFFCQLRSWNFSFVPSNTYWKKFLFHIYTIFQNTKNLKNYIQNMQ